MNIEKIISDQRVQIAVAIVVVVLILYSTGILDKPVGKTFNLDPNDDGVREGFEPVNEAIAIYDMLSKWDIMNSTSRLQAFTKIQSYNNNELRLVANAYRKEYKKEKANTLRKLVQSEFIWLRPAEEQARAIVLQRLANIGA